jgi:hypothetical protein
MDERIIDRKVKKRSVLFLLTVKAEKVTYPLLMSPFKYAGQGRFSIPVHLLYLSIDTQPSTFYTTINQKGVIITLRVL